MYRSTWLHLRIPFSIYLMPVFVFAASQYPLAGLRSLIITFLALHLFLYPACNGYNSYFDKDTESIGGLRNPPPVQLQLYYASLIFDMAALVTGLLISWQFAVMMLVYGLVSKAYSHPVVRLKKYGFTALAVVAVFQGGYAYMMSYLGLHHLNFSQLADEKIIFPALLATIMMLGFYPMTQIYQHREDAERGDRTASLQLGLHGTFLFCAVVFLIANAGFYFYFARYSNSILLFILFQIFTAPVFIFFIRWYIVFRKNPAQANFTNTMLLNKISSWCLIAFFITCAWLQGIH